MSAGKPVGTAAFALVVLALGLLAVGPEVQADPIASWSFDEADGDTAHDGTGNGYDATLYGGAEFVPGVVGNAISFDGSGAYAEVTALSPVYLGTYTVEAWINYRTAPAGDSSCILGKGRSGHEYNYNYRLLIYGDGTFVASHEAQDDTRSLVSAPIAANAWHHIAASYDGTDMCLYVDGELRDTAYGAAPPGTLGPWPLAIGCTGEHDSFFDGMIDELKIHDYALTPGQVGVVPDPTTAAFFALSVPALVGWVRWRRRSKRAA